jgi:hypothetical protein
MKVRQFLDVVPKPVKTAAYALVAGAALIGVTAAFIRSTNDAYYLMQGLCFGLLGGGVVAIWVLCLGFVYADARRRAMPPILWTLIVAFIPNLLGFLLYFALRRPIALPCSQCGMAITPQQRFCSWCGYQGSSALSGQAS